jgi:hypothetical protein
VNCARTERGGPSERVRPHRQIRSESHRSSSPSDTAKLAPPAISHPIDTTRAGGSFDRDEYKISHFERYHEERKATLSNERYKPERGERDGELTTERGTTIRLKEFNHKRVSRKETFSRQLGYKFATGLPDFNVVIEDTDEEDPEEEFTLEDIDIPIEEQTKVDVSERPVQGEDQWYDVGGWMAMSKKPYKDEFGGVRIYVRGKLASITKDFGLGPSFTGAYIARSYLVGEVHADFLDQQEDLIQTHRKDILWDSRLGSYLQEWGKEIVKEIAKKGKKPRRKKASNRFMEASDLEGKAVERYGEGAGITETAVELGEKFGQFAHEDELEDPDYVDDFSNFVIEIAPHKHLVDAFHELRERAEGETIEIDELIEVLEATNIAEMTSFGQVAAEKVETIDILEETIRDDGTSERDLQEILEEAPWLIKAEWQPMAADESIETFRSAFESWYEDEYEEELITTTDIEHGTKRPDFVMLHLDSAVKIIEIKRPGHEFDKDDFDRFARYVDAFEKFFEENKGFLEDFPDGPEFIIVADGINLNRTRRRALNDMKNEDLLKGVKTWEVLLRETKMRHQDFIQARRQIPSNSASDEG